MRFLFALAVIALTGCMKPDSKGLEPESNEPTIKDMDLRAGATSSTNWPTEDAGHTPMVISGRADSSLLLVFHNTQTTTEAIAGMVTFYQGGVIPALDTIITKSFAFQKTDTLHILPEEFQGMPSIGKDTVLFSIGIESDTLSSLIVGFAYSLKQKAFLRSPFSVDSTSFPKLAAPKYSFKGLVDSSLAKSGSSFPGNEQWCFYIPGTPYFWKAGFGSTLEIGPLPYGKFPFRLLRILASEGKLGRNRLEVFELNVVEAPITGPGQIPTYYIKVGDQVLGIDVPTSLSIRSKSP